jgi:hypothetical protein
MRADGRGGLPPLGSSRPFYVGRWPVSVSTAHTSTNLKAPRAVIACFPHRLRSSSQATHYRNGDQQDRRDGKGGESGVVYAGAPQAAVKTTGFTPNH